MDMEKVFVRMTPQLWRALAILEKGEERANLRHGLPPQVWDEFDQLEKLGLVKWREYGSYKEWEEYSINKHGIALLEKYRHSNDES